MILYFCNGWEKIFLLSYFLDNGTVLTGLDCLLWAVGRTPNTDKLNCQAAGIQLDKVGRRSIKKVVLYSITMPLPF
jgi:hypothetical protein